MLDGRIEDCEDTGARIEDSGANATPTNNGVQGLRATDTGTGVQDYGVKTTSDASGTLVINNDLRGNVTGATNLNGTGTITDPVGQATAEDFNIT
ncbi:hypothetical protein [Haloarchaeobius salinus]|uniref:hypothetical protein n=1 Tax=Haloarchaeobius salinus TaxID=1198298 RepID=UPI00210B2242|nr:hypothetical protein [Haloarchaeobius salinus]